MSKSTCCSICLSTNRRTINIYGTILQYIYETLAYYKITDVECWMCYICHTRLRQCHQLRQLAMQTRGCTRFVLQNKVDHRVYRSVVKLSTSRIMTISTVPTPIKQESDVKTEVCSDNELEAERIDNEVEKKTSIKSKCASTKKVSEITFEEVSQSEKYDQYPTTSSGHAKINHERAENIKNKGDEQNKQVNTDQAQDASKAETKVLHKCNVCSKRFPTKSLLVIHSRTHTGEKPFRCDVCFSNFKHKSHLTVHKRIQTVCRPYTCDICSKQFSSYLEIRYHKLFHKARQLHSCAVCSKSFTQKCNLNDHMHVHTGVKPYLCDICSKKYAWKGDLQKHLLTHSEIKDFSCEVCSKKFTEKRYLVSHSFVHTGIKNYTCDVCAKRFSRKCELNKHKHTHTDYKPHNCDLCSKSFSTKKHLNCHVRIHTGEKPFSCDICLKKFTRKGNLRVHRLTHIHDQHLL